MEGHIGSLQGSQQRASQGAWGDPNVDAGLYEGCLLYEKGDYQAALQQFTNASAACGKLPDLCYGLAVCCYR